MTMDKLLAMSLADDMLASFPGRSLGDHHVVRWAKELELMTEYEGRKVVELVTSRSQDPPSRAALRQALAEVRHDTMSPRFDASLCTYADGVVCRNCGEVHGHLVSPEVVVHGVHHWRALLDGDETARARAVSPETCGCGFGGGQTFEDGMVRLGESVTSKGDA